MYSSYLIDEESDTSDGSHIPFIMVVTPRELNDSGIK